MGKAFLALLTPWLHPKWLGLGENFLVNKLRKSSLKISGRKFNSLFVHAATRGEAKLKAVDTEQCCAKSSGLRVRGLAATPAIGNVSDLLCGSGEVA